MLPPTLYGLIVHLSGGTRAQVAAVIGIGVVFFGAIPLVSMVRAIRGIPHASIELRDRTHRTIPYLVAVGSYLVALFIVARSSLPEREFLMAVTLSFVISGFLMLVINLSWKISLHVSTLAGFFSILWYYLSRVNPGALTDATTGDGAPMMRLAVFGIAVTALVMWARVEVRAHTPAQVFGGAAFGLVAPYVTLLILAWIGVQA